MLTLLTMLTMLTMMAHYCAPFRHAGHKMPWHHMHHAAISKGFGPKPKKNPARKSIVGSGGGGDDGGGGGGGGGTVRHPFLASHPHFEIAKKQMDGGSGIVTLELDGDLETTRTFVSSLALFSLAESLGGIESLVDHPASMTHASIPRAEREQVGITDGLVRLSVGIEAVEDLLADLDQALARAELPTIPSLHR